MQAEGVRPEQEIGGKERGLFPMCEVHKPTSKVELCDDANAPQFPFCIPDLWHSSTVSRVKTSDIAAQSYLCLSEKGQGGIVRKPIKQYGERDTQDTSLLPP